MLTRVALYALAGLLLTAACVAAWRMAFVAPRTALAECQAENAALKQPKPKADTRQIEVRYVDRIVEVEKQAVSVRARVASSCLRSADSHTTVPKPASLSNEATARDESISSDEISNNLEAGAQNTVQCGALMEWVRANSAQ